MTTFKPFNVRELEYDVWDTSRAKNDGFLAQFEEQGLLGGGGRKDYQHPFSTHQEPAQHSHSPGAPATDNQQRNTGPISSFNDRDRPAQLQGNSGHNDSMMKKSVRFDDNTNYNNRKSSPPRYR